MQIFLPTVIKLKNNGTRNNAKYMPYRREMKEEQKKLQLDYEDAAQSLSLSVQALRDLVYKGRGPITVRIGRRTFFTPHDLQTFVDKHRETNQ